MISIPAVWPVKFESATCVGLSVGYFHLRLIDIRLAVSEKGHNRNRNSTRSTRAHPGDLARQCNFVSLSLPLLAFELQVVDNTHKLETVDGDDLRTLKLDNVCNRGSCGGGQVRLVQ